MFVREWPRFVFKYWDGSCLDRDYMLNTVDDILEILGGMRYLNDLMNQLFLVVASLIMLFVNVKSMWI